MQTNSDLVSGEIKHVVLPFEAYRREFKAVRCFQPYSVNERADHAASNRVGYRKRAAVGEFFYTQIHAPACAFPTRTKAEMAGYRFYLESLSVK